MLVQKTFVTMPIVHSQTHHHCRKRAQSRDCAACAGCHALTDLLGLGLERFDGIGAFRNLENNSVIDPSGILDGTEFTDALGLGRALAEHPNLVPCMVETLWSFANGRVVQTREEEQIETITERFAASGHRLLALMEDIALSEGFRHLDSSEASP